jgi:hypothetical protein
MKEKTMKKTWTGNWKNSPGNEDNHYDGEMQPVEYFASSKPEAFTANIEKYVLRHAKKAGKLDLEKARWYVDWLRRSMNGGTAICAGDFIAANKLEDEAKEIMLQLEEFEVEADMDRSYEILDDVDRLIVKLIRKHYS